MVRHTHNCAGFCPLPSTSSQLDFPFNIASFLIQVYCTIPEGLLEVDISPDTLNSDLVKRLVHLGCKVNFFSLDHSSSFLSALTELTRQQTQQLIRQWRR